MFPRTVFGFVAMSAGVMISHGADGPVAQVLQPYVDSKTLPGAVTLVADKDKVLDVTAVGFADIEAGKATKADDIFWIASMTKPVTGVAVMMLVEEGKIDLEAPVTKYLPEFEKLTVVEKGVEGAQPRAPKSPLLVRHLLSMGGGMRFSSEFEKPTLDQGTLAERVKSYAEMPLDYDPGTRFQYSNAGINTAGRLIEVVTGKSYEDFVDERLLHPLGMKDTTFWPSEEQVERLAKAYSGTNEITIGQLTYPLTLRSRQPMPAGGLFSTAADMARFGQMLLNGGTLDGKQYLKPETVAEMGLKHSPEASPDAYGYGMVVEGEGKYGHGGAFKTDLTIDPQRGLVYVFLVHVGGWSNEEEGNKILPAFWKAAGELGAKK